MDTARFSISMSEELYERLREYAEGRLDKPSMNQVIRESLVFYLSNVVIESNVSLTKPVRLPSTVFSPAT